MKERWRITANAPFATDYLQSGQQPVPASFVAALALVASKATSAIANPKIFAFMEDPPAHQGSPMWRSIRHDFQRTGCSHIEGQAQTPFENYLTFKSA